MNFLLLSAEQVEALHDLVLNAGELPGRARNKSLEGVLARVDNRLMYGMINDVFDLSVAYAAAVAQGHCFNDGNKHTAYRTMLVCLTLNGISIAHDTEEVGQMIIQLGQGHIGEDDMAGWLRNQTV